MARRLNAVVWVEVEDVCGGIVGAVFADKGGGYVVCKSRLIVGCRLRSGRGRGGRVGSVVGGAVGLGHGLRRKRGKRRDQSGTGCLCCRIG